VVQASNQGKQMQASKQMVLAPSMVIDGADLESANKNSTAMGSWCKK
jgi:hypothetical protein